jgi:hypothetical protein
VPGVKLVLTREGKPLTCESGDNIVKDFNMIGVSDDLFADCSVNSISDGDGISKAEVRY